MKRIVISGLLVISICLCTGCIQSQSDNSSVITQNLQNTQAISNWNASDVEKSISEKNYANLKFTNDFTVIAPESVQTLSRMTCTSKENISQKGLQEVFDKALIDIFSGRFTQTELDDFRKNVQVQENMLFLENEKMGLTVMQPGYIHAYNRGIALELDDNPSPANIYFPSELHSVLEVYNTNQLDSKDSYTLTDGNCTIQDAVQIVEQRLQTENTENLLIPKVHKVQVVSLTDTVQVLQMEVVLSYENLPFDCADVSEFGSFTYTSLMERTQKRSYNFLPATVLLSSKDGIDFQVGLRMDETITIQETKENCMTPESAMDAASNYLTQNVVFHVEQMELVYSQYTDGDENTVSQIDPIWKIRMYNENDQLYYAVQIDALDGSCVECYSYTKES